MGILRRLISLGLVAVLLLNFANPSIARAEEMTSDTTIQYRYREKEYCTSDEELSDPWMLVDTNSTVYHYDYQYLYIYVDSFDSWEANNGDRYCIHSQSAKYRYVKYDSQGNIVDSVYINGSTGATELYEQGYHNGGDYIEIKYCTKKETVSTYRYYKWGEWSEWSETAVIATEDREIETRELYTITYDANGGDAAPSAQTKIQNEDLVLSMDIPTRDGYTFTGWSTTSDGEAEYTAGANCSLDESVTLYAVWRADTYTISYDANGGSNAPEVQTKERDLDLVLSDQQPVRAGYNFLGWSSNMDGTVEYSPADTYVQNASVVLYAIWEAQPEVEFSWKLSSAGVLTIQGTCAMPDWEAGGAPWYSKRYTIKKIIIEEGITNIGNYAFQDCTMVSNVIIPLTVRTIGVSSFSSCNSLKSITIPAGVSLIGDNAFEYCNSLARVTLNSGLATIGSKAYTHCTQLNDINFPESLKTVDDFAFEGCSALSQITIPNSVKSIGVAAFIDCTSLTSVILSENMTSIPEHAFAYCSNLLSISIPDSVTTIDMYAFYSCTRMTEVVLGSQLESIGSYAFCGCEGLMEICIPKSAMVLYDNCFNSCSNLKRLTIFSSVTLIDTAAFRYCNALETIYYCGSEAQWYATTINTNNDPLFDATLILRNIYFSGAALILHDNLAVNYKVDKALFETIGYVEPYVVFDFNGVQTRVDSYTLEGDKYVFSFTNIAPNQMTDTIYATLYASFDGMVFSSETKAYSVATYCYNMLEKCSSDDYAEFRTLLVDLLHYGAASQTYTGYKTDELVDAKLTSAQLAWGTAADRTLVNALDTAYETVETPWVVWKGAGLNLEDSVTIRLKFEAIDIEGLTLKIESQCGTWEIQDVDLIPAGDVYYAYFSGLNAAQMSEMLYMTFYRDGLPVSNTVCYSIESYASSKQNSGTTALTELLKAMMRYGDSARIYVN